MLTPEYLDGLPDPIVELYAQVEAAILADMARRIVKTDLWTPSADWQYRKLREAGAASEEIIKQLSRITGKTQAEIRRIMQAAAIESMGYDEGIYETHGMTGEPLASSDALTEILNAGYWATMQTMRNLTRTTAHTASRQFMRLMSRQVSRFIGFVLRHDRYPFFQDANLFSGVPEQIAKSAFPQSEVVRQ